jgi:hypothetical protein
MAAVWRYARRRAFGGRPYVRSMLDPALVGAPSMTSAQRTDALRADAILRRLGIRCLWRSAIVTEQLRDSGVAARVGISISARDPRRAHAECEVAGEPLRPHDEESVRLL